MKKRLLCLLFCVFLIIYNSTMVEAAETYLWPVYGHTSLSRGWSNSHDGLDISDSTVAGATVRATKSGTVVRVFTGCNNYNGMTTGNCQGKGKCSPNNGYWNGLCNYGFGNGVIIQHNDGGYSSYAHMGSVSVSVGNSVSRGQPIGTVGSTGNSSGPHLHFSLNTAILGSGYNNNKDVISYDYGGNNSSKITFDAPETPSGNIGAVNFGVWFSNNNAYNLSAVGFEISVNNGGFTSYTTAQNVSWSRSYLECNLSNFVNTNASEYKVRAFVTVNGETFRSETATIHLNTPITFDTYSTPSNNTDEVNCTVWYSNNNAYNISAVGYEIAANGGDFNTYTVYQNVSWTRVHMQCKLSDYVPLTTTDYSVRVFAIIGNDTYRSNIMSVHLNLNDIQAPVITNFRITDIDFDGYTMACDVNDNIAVSRVEFPTWTAKDGQDDLTWHKATIDGNTASCRINVSEHGNERDIYYSEAYAWDATGNYSKTNTEISLVNWAIPTSMVYNGHYYCAYTFNGNYDWESAKIFCEKLGGHLATIVSPEENEAVLDLMIKAGKEQAWIGATDKVEEGNWKWINGEAFSYSNWAEGQPDNYNGEQNYSVMQKEGKWDDVALFSGTSCFIFEYDKPYTIKISNAEITDIDDTGYTVSCTIDSEFPLKNVSFPTWTALNMQDDIIDKWETNPQCFGTINGNKVTYRVNASDHNNEIGLYITHIYAYDTNGNCYSDIPINKKLHTIIGNPQPSNTAEYNGHRYELYVLGGEYEWKHAQNFCDEKGGHLATITSTEENSIIHQLIQSSENNFLIGGTDKDSEGEWKWITGEPFNYTNWNETQPDNYEDEDYLMMYNSNGKWNDCHETLKGFICEYESTPSLNAKLTKKDGYSIISIKPQYIEAGNNIVIAAYKNKILTDIQTESYNGEDISTVTFAEYDTIKAMIWKDMSSMIPLAKAEILN